MVAPSRLRFMYLNTLLRHGYKACWKVEKWNSNMSSKEKSCLKSTLHNSRAIFKVHE